MRTCKICKCTDDTIKPGDYWIKDDECSAHADPEKVHAVKPHDGTNDEYANEK